MSAGRPDVVVIGGGVIGCAVAWRLARRDVDVVLVERDEPGAHASAAAAGMLSPLKEAEEPGPFLDLGLRSLERYPEFVRAVESASGIDVGYRRDGRLDVALLSRSDDWLVATFLPYGRRVEVLEPAETKKAMESARDRVLAKYS